MESLEKKELKYQLLDGGSGAQNCSGLVMELLGTIKKNFNYNPTKFYTPNDVAHEVYQLKEKEITMYRKDYSIGIENIDQAIETMDMISHDHFHTSEVPSGCGLLVLKKTEMFLLPLSKERSGKLHYFYVVTEDEIFYMDKYIHPDLFIKIQLKEMKTLREHVALITQFQTPGFRELSAKHLTIIQELTSHSSEQGSRRSIMRRGSKQPPLSPEKKQEEKQEEKREDEKDEKDERGDKDKISLFPGKIQELPAGEPNNKELKPFWVRLKDRNPSNIEKNNLLIRPELFVIRKEEKKTDERNLSTSMIKNATYELGFAYGKNKYEQKLIDDEDCLRYLSDLHGIGIGTGILGENEKIREKLYNICLKHRGYVYPKQKTWGICLIA